jgi:DNA-binding transcriptional LysR family regulator
MELRHLRYFVAVCEAGTVSRAAERLNTTQPSLSRQIHDLEDELGVSLFERVGRRLQLTGEGEDLLEEARKVLNQAVQFRERASVLRHGDVGVLRVGATPQSIERLFPTLLQRFAQSKPRVQVRLTEGDTESLSGNLRDGELHVALTAYQPEWRASAQVLGVAPLLAISKTPIVGSDGSIEVGDLEYMPLLVFRRGFGSRDLFDAACQMAHISSTIYLESNAPAPLLAMALSGKGVCVLPATVAPPDGDVNAYRLTQDGKPLELRFAAHWNPRRYFPPYAEHFVADLVAVAQEQFSKAIGAWKIRISED